MNRREFIGAGAAVGASAWLGTWTKAFAAAAKDPSVGGKWTGWTKGHFQIHSIYTGVGESLFLIFPDGTTALLDCGDWPAVKRGKLAVPCLPDAETHAGEWVARYIDRVNPRKGEVDYMIVSHFHSDHTGIENWAKPKPPGFPDNGGCARSGFALVAETVKFRRAIDRGWPDYNQPLVIDKDGREELAHMRKVYAWLQKRDGLHVEQCRLGASGQIAQLHEPAAYPGFEVRNICCNGMIFRKDGTVDDTLYLRYRRGQRKCENAMSIGHVFRYGAFSFYTAGDFSDRLWAGEGKPAYWIEDALCDAVGPVQVAKINHHGYKSMSPKLVGTLRARVWIANVWDQLHVLAETMERLCDRKTYPDERLIVPGIFTKERRAEDAGKPWMKDVPAEVYEAAHVVIDVPPGGKTYSMAFLGAADEKMTVRGRMQFRS